MTPLDMIRRMEYNITDLNVIKLEKAELYGLVYSSLALHYLPNNSVTRPLNVIFMALKPGGRFVFSVEHPIFTAPSSDPKRKR